MNTRRRGVPSSEPQCKERREFVEYMQEYARQGKMEEEIKPKILKLLESLNKNYLKLQKYQKENYNGYQNLFHKNGMYRPM